MSQNLGHGSKGDVVDLWHTSSKIEVITRLISKLNTKEITWCFQVMCHEVYMKISFGHKGISLIINIEENEIHINFKYHKAHRFDLARQLLNQFSRG